MERDIEPCGSRWKRRELGDGRLAENSILGKRRIGTMESSELRFGWRRGCHSNDWTDDANNTSGVRRAWVASRVWTLIGLIEKKPPSAHDDV